MASTLHPSANITGVYSIVIEGFFLQRAASIARQPIFLNGGGVRFDLDIKVLGGLKRSRDSVSSPAIKAGLKTTEDRSPPGLNNEGLSPPAQPRHPPLSLLTSRRHTALRRSAVSASETAR